MVGIMLSMVLIGLVLIVNGHAVGPQAADLTHDSELFTLSYEGSGIQKQKIPARILYHKN